MVGMRRMLVLVVALVVFGTVGLVSVLSAPAVAQTTTTSGLCDTTTVEQFADVADGDYAAAYVLCMRALALSQGDGDGGYGPDRDLNRAQMASFLVRLWRDVLGNECPSAVVSPFVDVAADSVHADNIDCLYGLGIAAGTTATTYGPHDPLKASQITRFLYRLYKKAGNTCESGTSELEEAVDCLLALRVIPSAAEGRNSDTVTRRQMAISVIGLWHNLAGRGLPPSPLDSTESQAALDLAALDLPQLGSSDVRRINPDLPTNADLSAIDLSDSTDPRVAPFEATGSHTIPVFYCGPSVARWRSTIFTPHEDLTRVVGYYNETIGAYHSWLSSNRLDLSYTVGSIITPSNFPTRPNGDPISIDEYTLNYINGEDVCIERVLQDTSASSVIVLTATRIGNTESVGHCFGFFDHIETSDQDVIVLPIFNLAASLYPDPNGDPIGHVGRQIRDLMGIYHTPGFFLYTDFSPISDSSVSNWILHLDKITPYTSDHRFVPDRHSFGHPIELSYTPLTCYQLDSLGWPVGGDSPPCFKLLPSSPRITSVTEGSGRITFRWLPPSFTDGVPITGYTVGISRGDTGHGPDLTESRLPSEPTSFTFDHLNRPARYNLSVRAHTQFGVGYDSFERFDFVASPESVWVSDMRGSTFEVSWNPVVGATHYIVWDSALNPPDTYSVDEYGTVSRQFTGRRVEGTTSTELTGHELGTTYTVKVRACGFADIFGSKQCSDGTIVTVTPTAPTTTGFPDVVSAEVGDTWVELEWNPVPGANYYLVVPPSGTYIHVGEDTSTIVRDLDPEARYEVEILPCNMFTTQDSDGRGIVVKYLCPPYDKLRVAVTTAPSGQSYPAVSANSPSAPAVLPPAPENVAETEEWARRGSWYITLDPVSGADYYYGEVYEEITGRVPTLSRGTSYGANLSDTGFAKGIEFHVPIFSFDLDPDTTYHFVVTSCTTKVSIVEHLAVKRTFCGEGKTIVTFTTDSTNEREATRPVTYTAVATGLYHSCALHTDQTIICWGSNQYAQTDAPAGKYTAVATGQYHSCALRPDQTITCWGDNRLAQIDAPAGKYTAVISGSAHSCALRPDQTITCWGDNRYGQTEAPAGEHTAVISGSAHSCALRPDQTITCWGNNRHGQTEAPAGKYTAVATGLYHSCALRPDQTITCWGGNQYAQTDAPAGKYTAVAAGSGHSCALRPDQTITCWGDNRHGQTEAPAGEYTAVISGPSGHSCALHADQTITCWGYNLYGQTQAPAGEYTAVLAGGSNTALRR